MRAAPARLCCTGPRTGRHASSMHKACCLSQVPLACQPAAETLGARCHLRSPLASARSHTLLAVARRQHRCEKQAAVLGAAAVQAGRQARRSRVSLAHHAHTSCTPCALRGHACRLTRLRFVPMRRRARAACGPGEQKCSPGDCRLVRLGALCCIATPDELWAREAARWLVFGICRCWLVWCHIFFRKMRVRA